MAHTTGGSEKPTEESARERGLGVGVGRDSRYGSIYVCPPSPFAKVVYTRGLA
jgi:hypothetical protein